MQWVNYIFKKLKILLNRNIICGPKSQIFPVIGMCLAYILIYLSWFFFINDLFEKKFEIKSIFYVNTILFVFLIYNFIRCYVSDPGIIPKNLEGNYSKSANVNFDNNKSNDIENAYNFLAFSNNNSKDLNLDLDNNMSKYIMSKISFSFSLYF